MSNNIYVGNLTYAIDEDALHKLFSPYGPVRSAQVIKDRETGRSKGFGFVEMGNPAATQAAIAGLNGKAVEGRSLVVNEARPRETASAGKGFRGQAC